MRIGTGWLAVAAVALALAACGDDGGDSGDFTLLSADVERTSPDETLAGTAADSGARFGFDMFRALDDDGANQAVSPYSVQVALSMTRNGARGTTLDEMSAVLRVDDPAGSTYDESLNALDQLLLSRAGEYVVSNGEEVTLELSTANSLWGQRGVTFEDAFLEDLARWYGAGMRVVDYDTATEEARQAINGWVSDQTRERIPELIPQGVLSPATVLVLTNALYLNAPWAFPFEEEDTEDGMFTRLDGSTVQATMMHQVMKFAYADGPGYAAVELPYANPALAMLLVVPDEGEFEGVQEAFDAAMLDSIVAELSEYTVTLDMPRFEFRFQVVLNEILAELGMPTAFGGGADFSGMTAEADLFISAVLHEVFISVDEEGTEAAAATAVVMDESAAPGTAELRIDRPFFFAIRDTQTGALLFLGRVMDPTAE